MSSQRTRRLLSGALSSSDSRRDRSQMSKLPGDRDRTQDIHVAVAASCLILQPGRRGLGEGWRPRWTGLSPWTWLVSRLCHQEREEGREATFTARVSWALASYFKKFSCEWQKQHATCLAGDAGTLLILRKCAVTGLLVCPLPRPPNLGGGPPRGEGSGY